jgi:transcriptional regulator with XRE-family HTH domain
MRSFVTKALALDSLTTFGDLLKYLRQRERLTQRDLGQAVGYGQAQINRLESNTRLPDVGLVVAQFIAALHLEDDLPAAARLVELAAQARGEPVPASFTLTRSTRHELTEEVDFSPRKRRSNLPAQVTSFIGREGDIAELSERVKATRLLTLTGAGGCGKTRLSLEVGSRLVGATESVAPTTRIFPTASGWSSSRRLRMGHSYHAQWLAPSTCPMLLGLAAMAGMLQAQGEAQQAVRLCGFGSNFQQPVRAVFMPAERAGYERTLAAARARLDYPELAAAWAEGQKMTLDEVVELALATA